MIAADGKVCAGKVPEPVPQPTSLVVEAIAVGVCGTDRWLRSRGKLAIPPSADHFVLGHESVGRVLWAPADTGFSRDDLVVGVVRSPDPLQCRRCRVGDYDLCENDRYTERGVHGEDGFGVEHYVLEPSGAVRVGPSLGLAAVLVEPTSVVVKAWEQVDRVARESPQRVLVLGAGPIGLLATLLSVRRAHDVSVVDRVHHGPKLALTTALGARYSVIDNLTGLFDAVFECTGVLRHDAVRLTAPGGVTCLIGDEDPKPNDVGFSSVANELIMHNKTVLGTVSSHRRHYEMARDVLQDSEQAWLESLIGLRVDLEQWQTAFDAPAEVVKAVVGFTDI